MKKTHVIDAVYYSLMQRYEDGDEDCRVMYSQVGVRARVESALY